VTKIALTTILEGDIMIKILQQNLETKILGMEEIGRKKSTTVCYMFGSSH
jgi:hypothetical protein